MPYGGRSVLGPTGSTLIYEPLSHTRSACTSTCSAGHFHSFLSSQQTGIAIFPSVSTDSASAFWFVSQLRASIRLAGAHMTAGRAVMRKVQ